MHRRAVAARAAPARRRGRAGRPEHPAGPGRPRRGEALLESLDAAGRRDIARARAELNLAIDRAADRLVTDTLASPRAKRAIDRLLESPELWTLVDRIANSPEVLNAVASASVGLTSVVADEARKRTVTADEFAERIARRVLGRAPARHRRLHRTAPERTARRNRDRSEPGDAVGQTRSSRESSAGDARLRWT